MRAARAVSAAGATASRAPDATPRRRPRPRRGRVLHRPRRTPALDLCDPGLRPAPRAGPGRRAGAADRAPTPRVGIAYAGEPWVSVPWRFLVAASPSRGRAEHADGRPVDRAPRVPGRPRPPRGEDVVRPVAPTRRGARAVVRRGHRARAASTRPTRRAPCSRSGRASASAPRTTSTPGWAARSAADASIAHQFLEIAETLDAAARLATSLAEERRPLLRDLGRRLHPLPALRSTLARSFDPVGELLDTASPRLGALRGAVRSPTTGCAVAWTRWWARSWAARSRSRSSRCATGATSSRSAPTRAPRSRASSTTRRAAARRCSWSRWSSWSWATPGARPRRRWTRRRAGSSTSSRRWSAPTRTLLRETLEALAQFDFWAAKAQLAAEMDGVRPEAAERTEVILLSARHPGLTGAWCPIDLRLGDGYTALVITGPNTGGKTVALRTLGLLALMHQAGPPRARRRRARACRCSATCSRTSATSSPSPSRCRRSPATCGRSPGSWRTPGPGTLVLLDELGAGTDPTEGSALAQALLDHFIRSGALVAATTHYAEIKVYAHETPAARNASVEFDLETLSPTYRLTIGLPGGSQAFAIAERLGLPDAIVADARSRLSENQRAFEATLASIRTPGGRDRRGRGAGPRRRGQGRRGAALRRRGAPPRPPRARRGRARPPATRPSASWTRSATTWRASAAGSSARRSRRPAIDAALARAEQTLERLPEAPHGARAPRAGRAAHVAPGRARPQPERRLGGPDRGAGEGRHARDARGRRHARVGRRGGPGARRGHRRRAGEPATEAAAVRAAAPGADRRRHGPHDRDLQPPPRARPQRGVVAGPARAPASTRRSTRSAATSTTPRWRAWSR